MKDAIGTIVILVVSFIIAMVAGAGVFDWLGYGAAALVMALSFVLSIKALDALFP